MKNEKAFVKELTELSKKYKIIIGGCGCCGSPFLSEMENENGQYYKVRGKDIDWLDDDSSNYEFYKEEIREYDE